ncbi:hypothetical protein PIB30_025844 [Stylosanthes scabra]|uniref:Reverse transcriptase zinc-binding domain-containing protein n=1 Tax=Stylosanthes scabra TaxID=79078 RepID=A0ABU6V9S3_9FABA|nr:hypothetical protein [Stylosanthes scabra]
MLATLIPENLKNFINRFQPRTSHRDIPSWIWAPSSLEVYSAREEYLWFARRNFMWQDSANWLWIWRLSVLEKIKCLMWVYLHEALPTNVLRCTRGVNYLLFGKDYLWFGNVDSVMSLTANTAADFLAKRALEMNVDYMELLELMRNMHMSQRDYPSNSSMMS